MIVLYGPTAPNIRTYSSECGEHDSGPVQAHVLPQERTNATAQSDPHTIMPAQACQKMERYAPLGPPPDANESRTVRAEPTYNVQALGTSDPPLQACTEALLLAAPCRPFMRHLRASRTTENAAKMRPRQRLRRRAWPAWTMWWQRRCGGVQRRAST